MADLVWRDEIVNKQLDYTNDLVSNLFFANVTTDATEPYDAVSGRVADTISTLSEIDGEFYEQKETATLDPTSWSIPYPYKDLGGSDDSSFTFHWRVRVSDIGSTAAYFWEWGSGEIRLQRYINEIRLHFAGTYFTITTGVSVGDILNITMTRDSATNDFHIIVNGTKTLLANFAYTTFNQADVIRYFNEADQRGEGIACFYAWVDRKLTDAEIQSLAENPYQLFATREDKQEEYALEPVLNGTTKIDFPTFTALAGEDFTIRIRYKIKSTGYSHMIAGSTSQNYIFYQNGLRIKLGGADAQTGSGVGDTLDQWYDLEIKRTGNNLIANLDGTEVYNQTTSTADVTLWRAMYADQYSSKTAYQYIELLNHANPTNNRLYNFNRTQGTNVLDLYGSANNATLVNFPEQSGYIREHKNATALAFDGVDDYMSFSNNTLHQGLAQWRIELRVKVDSYSANNQFYLFGDSGTLFYGGIRFRSNGEIRIRYNTDEATITGTPNLADGSFHTVILSRDAAGVHYCTVDGSPEGTNPVETSTSATNLNQLFLSSTVDPNRVAGLQVEYVCLYDSDTGGSLVVGWGATASNHSAGGQPVLKDTVGGNNATGVGFATDGSVWRGNNGDYGDIVGYRFNGVDTKATFTPTVLHSDSTLTGWKYKASFGFTGTSARLIGNTTDYSAYISVGTDSISVRFGTGSSTTQVIPLNSSIPNDGILRELIIEKLGSEFIVELNGVEIAREDVVKTPSSVTNNAIGCSYTSFYEMRVEYIEFYRNGEQSPTHKWDFTTGDPDTIIDTVGNNHATIVNQPTSGYLPVVEKQVFTVGTGRDYATQPNLVTNQSASIYFVEAVQYGSLAEWDRIRDSDGHFPNGLLYRAATGQEFYGDLNATNVATIDKVTYSRQDHQGDIEIRGILFKNLGFLLSAYSGLGGKNVFRRCGFLTEGNEALKFTNTVKGVEVYESVIKCGGRGVAVTGGTTITPVLRDTIIDSSGQAMYSASGALGYNAVNCLVMGTEFGDYSGAPFGSNNLTSFSDTADGFTQDTNLATYFVDSANGDYRINETGQTALAGQGWNGSDIASWAYAVVGGVELHSFTATIGFSVDEIAQQLKTAAIVGEVPQSFDKVPVVNKISDVSGVVGSSVDVERAINKTEEFASSLALQSVQNAHLNKAFEFTGSSPLSTGQEPLFSKSATQTSSNSFSFDKAGTFTKQAGVSGSNLIGNQPFGLSAPALFNKAADINSTVGFSVDGASKQTKVSRFSSVIPLELELDSVANKSGSQSSAMSFSYSEEGNTNKSGALHSTQAMGFNVSASILGENVEFYTYSFKLQGIVVDQRFKGVVLDLDKIK